MADAAWSEAEAGNAILARVQVAAALKSGSTKVLTEAVQSMQKTLTMELSSAEVAQMEPTYVRGMAYLQLTMTP